MKTRLAWLAQAALIVLPVLILSGVAVYFLHEDRTAIEQEAKDRAAALAPEAARRIAGQIRAFLMDAQRNGLLIHGRATASQGFAQRDYQPLPAPADWPSNLPPREAQLWQTAKSAIFENPNPAAARQALTALSEPGVSSPARANAQLSLLIAAEAHGDTASLIRQAIALDRQYPDEVTESGTPVADLALILALRHASNSSAPSDLIDAIDKTTSLHPSFLSIDLLNSLSGTTAFARLHADWLKQEADRAKTRDLMRALYFRLWSRKLPTIFLVPGGRVAFCAPNSWGWGVALADSTPLLRALHPDLPDYMGAWLNLSGQRQELGAPGRTKTTSLAWAQSRLTLDTTYTIPFLIDLRNPDLLYAPYRRRLLLTQWLIFSAVAAALFGLWRLWQTYLDQTRLNEMKSNLVSSVSHELRAPIAAVRLMAESLETGRVDGAEKQKDYYRLIVRECRRLSSLVENVLDFSRIDQGRKQYHREPVDAPALLRHTVMLMEPGAAERNVRLRLIDPPPAFETLQPLWDAEAIEQSLVNLLDNAIKHSASDSEVRIEVELLAATIRFWVIDAGPGIPPDEHRKIFDLFYRYGSELRRETEGVGIGLSIVKHVAEAHGGRVLVESNSGQGSRFGLELPR